MNIATLIQRNTVIVTGIALPLLIIIFFLLAQFVPRWLVDPPQHDFLFTSSHYSHDSEFPVNVQLKVKAGSLQATLRHSKNYSSVPQLFRFDHATSAVREISIELPAKPATVEDGQPILIPEVANLTIDTARRAPDGYQLQGDRNRGSGLIGELFFNGRHDRRHALIKQGATVPINTSHNQHITFLGWIVDQQE